MDFSVDEYKSRLSKTQDGMKKAGLPVILLHSPENIVYLSGFHVEDGFFSYHALVVPADGEPVLVVRDVEEPAAISQSWLRNRVVWTNTDKQPIESTQKALDGLGLAGGRIGIEQDSWFLTVERLSILKELLPKAEFVSERAIVQTIRLIKSPAEIEYMRKASNIVDAGMKAGIDAIAVGASELELAAAITQAQVRLGCESPLGGIMMSGDPGGRSLHATWTDRRLQQNDLVYFELQGISHHYWSKLMRTAVVGKATDDQRRAAEIIIKTQDAGIALMYPGVSSGEVDEACRAPILHAGLRESYPNRVGYGLGLVHHPSMGDFSREFMAGATWTLEAGMVFHMVLMAKDLGFSETLVVTENGPEILTKSARQLSEQG